MFELLLSGYHKEKIPNPSCELPVNSGPGPKELLGCTEGAGFFGETSQDELITFSELTSHLSVTAGTAMNANEPWLKFYIDGKIIYIPKKTIRRSISWDYINSLKLIDGSKIITINDLNYKVRLINMIRPDPDGYAWLWDFDTPLTHGSEYNRLFYPIYVGNPISQVGSNWIDPQYTDVDLGYGSTGNGNWWWGMEKWNSSNYNNGACIRYIKVDRLGVTPKNSTAATAGWRPVLELFE